MWKEVIIADFKVLFWHLPGGTLGKSLKTWEQPVSGSHFHLEKSVLCFVEKVFSVQVLSQVACFSANLSNYCKVFSYCHMFTEHNMTLFMNYQGLIFSFSSALKKSICNK
jgi:hypothetical protein